MIVAHMQERFINRLKPTDRNEVVIILCLKLTNDIVLRVMNGIWCRIMRNIYKGIVMKTKSLYIASLEPRAGNLFVTVGMMELLKRRFGKVAFFRPMIESSDKVDKDITFMLEHFSLGMEYEQAYGYTVDEVETMIANGKTKALLVALIKKFKALERSYDFVLCEGLNRSSLTSTIEFDINLRLTKNFGSPYISVVNGKGKKAKEILEELTIDVESIKGENVTHFAIFVNRLSEKAYKKLSEKIDAKQKRHAPVYFLPEVEELDRPTVMEVMETLECKYIRGSDEDLKRVVAQSKIAAMTLENYLGRIEEGDLVIVPGDRADIIVGSLAALYSHEFPHISAILLSGGFLPSENIIRLFKGLKYFPIPILSIESDTYTTAMRVNAVPSQIRPHSPRKIALALGLFRSHVDIEEIETKIKTVSSDIITPTMFEFKLFERARADRKKIVLPESSDDRILQATEILLRRDVVDIILLGDPKEIAHRSAMLGLDLSLAEIIDPMKSPLMDTYAQTFYELRKEKGLLLEGAKDAMSHATYFATMMVYAGYADGMVSGAIHTTGDTIRPALQIIKTKPDISIVSSVFFMCLDTRVLVYGDCAVNQEPDASQLAEIAISSAETAGMFGIESKIAMLSYSTGTSGTGEDVEKVRTATKLVKERRPDLLVEGPIQYDAAIEPTVAKTKLPDSDVAGKATVFIFPDLNTGNNTYKAVQRSSGAIAIGPVLQGLKKPVNDLSRGCLVADIVNTVAITAIQAQGVSE